MRIHVTQEDIERGQTGQIGVTHCPVALAIKRQAPQDTTAISVLYKSATLRTDHLVQRAELSKQATSWIRAFDRGEKVEPASFTLSFKDMG